MPDAAVTRHVYYLHGFASSARSKKAAYLDERFRKHGIALRIPDFNLPDFQSMTITRMLDYLAADIANLPAGPVSLIGSSLGAVVAIHTAAKLGSRIDKLVLMAPALTFAKDGHRFLGPERIARWEATGTLDVFHFGYGGMRPLNFTFYRDSLQYDAFSTKITQPVLIFQGLRDDAVDHRVVEAYAASKPNVTLALLDDDHQLIASLPRMWTDIEHFLTS